MTAKKPSAINTEIAVPAFAPEDIPLFWFSVTVEDDRRPADSAKVPVGVDIEFEKLVDGVSVSTTSVLLNTVVTNSSDVAELRNVEVAAAPPASDSVCTDVTTTSDWLVNIDVVRRIDVNVADTVTKYRVSVEFS
jgi:hypothetical protein